MVSRGAEVIREGRGEGASSGKPEASFPPQGSAGSGLETYRDHRQLPRGRYPTR